MDVLVIKNNFSQMEFTFQHQTQQARRVVFSVKLLNIPTVEA